MDDTQLDTAKPRQFFPALKIDAGNDMNGLVDYPLPITYLHNNTVHEHDGIDPVKGSSLLPPDILHDAFGDMADQGGENIGVIHPPDGCSNLPGGHVLAVQRYDLTLEYATSRLSFLDKLWLECSFAVTRNINGNLTFLGLYRLAALAVTAVGAGTTLISGMARMGMPVRLPELSLSDACACLR